MALHENIEGADDKYWVMTDWTEWKPFMNSFEVKPGDVCWLAICMPGGALGFGHSEKEAIDMAVSRAILKERRSNVQETSD